MKSQSPPSCLRIFHSSLRLPIHIDMHVNDQKVVQRLGYGHITAPFFIPSDPLLITVSNRHSGEKIMEKIVEPMFKGSYTLAFLEEKRKPCIIMFRDDPIPVKNRVKLRFIHLIPEIPFMNVSSPDHVLFSDVSFGESRFLTLPDYRSTIYLHIKDTDPITYQVPSIHLKEGETYTFFAVGNRTSDSRFHLLFLKES